MSLRRPRTSSYFRWIFELDPDATDRFVLIEGSLLNPSSWSIRLYEKGRKGVRNSRLGRRPTFACCKVLTHD
jgi:hypothetical protein